MKWELALLALCAFASAMVPRERRAVDSEELAKTGDGGASAGDAGAGDAGAGDAGAGNAGAGATSTAGPVKICAKNTPCGWLFYKPDFKVIELSINNTYCRCAAELNCEVDEDDQTGNMFVQRCREPGKSPINIES